MPTITAGVHLGNIYAGALYAALIALIDAKAEILEVFNFYLTFRAKELQCSVTVLAWLLHFLL